jgi:hypothetical protein
MVHNVLSTCSSRVVVMMVMQVMELVILVTTRRTVQLGVEQ